MANVFVIIGFCAAVTSTLLVSSTHAFVIDPSPSPSTSVDGVGLGKCNAANTPTMPTFDLAKYKGIWYETHRIPFFGEVLMSCVSTVVSYDDASNTANFTDTGFRFGRYTSVDETVTQPDAQSQPGKLEVRFKFPLSPVGPYWIIDTDYDTYSIVYSFLDLKIFRADNAWILTRKQGAPDDALVSKAVGILKSIGVDTSKLVATKQDSCPPRLQ